MSKIEDGIKVMLAELEAYEKSIIGFTQLGAGYTQEVMGEDRFACKICGHCPGALKERLKQLLEAGTPPVAPKTPSAKEEK